ncbi:MAG: tetratricopeptide repeat protein [Bdellovibrionales bacterium]|nr:tetratricopeptide repeat protein [Bdellovibrionales bacterium]
MVSKIIRFLLVAFVVVACIAAVYFNQELVTIHYGPHREITLMGGIIFLGCFAFGFACAYYFVITNSIKSYWRERTYKAKEEKQHQFINSLLEARALQSAGEVDRASQLWQQLIKRDPTSLLARVELSRTLEQGGDLRQALKVLDKAREADPSNVEVLLQAANINQKLGNKTAALDNLALALYQEPTPFAAAQARQLSIQLDRIEDAREYQKQFEIAGGDATSDESIELKFLGLKADLAQQGGEAEEVLERTLKAIRKFAHQHPRFLPAILELVELEIQAGNTSEAAESLLKAAKENQAPSLWKRAIDLWLEKDDGDRALAAAKTALRNASAKQDRQKAQLDLARVYVLTGKPEDALNTLSLVSELEESEDVSIRKEYLGLKGYSMNLQERYSEAAQVWKQLLEIRGEHEALLMLPYEPSANGGVTYYPALERVK